MTVDDFRRLALALPGVIESAHMGHPDFRAGGRIFASLSPGTDPSGMVRLPLDRQAEVLAEAPHVYTPASGAWGRQGCTMVRLAAAPAESVRAAMHDAWAACTAAAAAKPRPKPRARPKAKPAPTAKPKPRRTRR